VEQVQEPGLLDHGLRRLAAPVQHDEQGRVAPVGRNVGAVGPLHTGDLDDVLDAPDDRARLPGGEHRRSRTDVAADAHPDRGRDRGHQQQRELHGACCAHPPPVPHGDEYAPADALCVVATGALSVTTGRWTTLRSHGLPHA